MENHENVNGAGWAVAVVVLVVILVGSFLWWQDVEGRKRVLKSDPIPLEVMDALGGEFATSSYDGSGGTARVAKPDIIFLHNDQALWEEYCRRYKPKNFAEFETCYYIEHDF